MKWLVQNRFGGLLLIMAVMLLVQLLNSVSGYALNAWGLIPREFSALPGILFGPWLHGDWGHLLGNLSGIAILGCLTLLDSRREFYQASVFIILGSGVLIWLFGRSGIHIGASGWLFGLWGLLLGRAWYRRSLLDLAVAAVVLLLYGGLWNGLLPQRAVSFEAHLAGALCGLLYAMWSHRRQRRIDSGSGYGL